MNASELADTIQWGRHLSHMTPQEADTVIKSLRFAADMEKLTDHEKTLSVMFTREDPYMVVAVKTMNGIERFSGPDIYSAARKAVEALEGKQ